MFFPLNERTAIFRAGVVDGKFAQTQIAEAPACVEASAYGKQKVFVVCAMVFLT